MGAFNVSKVANKGKGLPGRNVPGVVAVDEFLRTCDASSSAGIVRVKGDVLVLGGSDTAVDAARAALRCGAEKATVVCPEKADETRASAEAVAAAKDEGVRFIRGWGPERIEAHPRDGRVSGVHFKHCDRAFNSKGEFAPVYDARNTMAQYADTVVLAEE